MDLILNTITSFFSLKDDDVTDIGINRAVELIEKNIQEKKEIIVGKYPETDINIIKKKGIKGRSDYLSFKRKTFQFLKNFQKKSCR